MKVATDQGLAPGASERPAEGQESSESKAPKRTRRDLRYRIRRYRQFVGVAFVFLLTFTGGPTPFLWGLGVALVLLGMGIRMWASGHVMKNEVLATDGPYAYVRHPLYVGNITMCAGFCAANGQWWSVPAALVLLLVFYPEAIRYEDGKLERIFGDDWRRWSQRTRALIPSSRPYGDGGDSTWSLKLSMMRNGEPIHVVVGLLCLAYLYAQIV